MEKIQLIHPEGKKAPAMDPTRYAVLRSSFLACLAQLQPAPFQELLQAVAADLEKQQVKIDGRKLEWHLFWYHWTWNPGRRSAGTGGCFPDQVFVGLNRLRTAVEDRKKARQVTAGLFYKEKYQAFAADAGAYTC